MKAPKVPACENHCRIGLIVQVALGCVAERASSRTGVGKTSLCLNSAIDLGDTTTCRIWGMILPFSILDRCHRIKGFAMNLGHLRRQTVSPLVPCDNPWRQPAFPLWTLLSDRYTSGSEVPRKGMKSRCGYFCDESWLSAHFPFRTSISTTEIPKRHNRIFCDNSRRHSSFLLLRRIS